MIQYYIDLSKELTRRKCKSKILRMSEKNNELKAKLLALLEREALKRGEFTLSSGKKSNYYLDGRVITLTPEGAYLVAEIILSMIADKSVDAVGGPTLGAYPIVGALACLAYQKKVPIKTFIVRKAAKEHGTRRLIEGPALPKGSRVILVDDVATTGKALVEAKRAVDEEGLKAETAIVIVDRIEGAAENLKSCGLKLESIYSIRDFGL
jgi:orotate phosphoribosyltransferase